MSSALQIMASMGVRDPSELGQHQLRRRLDPRTVLSYRALYDWLSPGQLTSEPPQEWEAGWRAADPDNFRH
ncbi:MULTISPECIES: hypothetical protein [unclassified Streptomyces]|uniref:hypothetical protein n=1 Tax=unclassified Streptomyces TaxID=2593676 RepID=UPI00352DFCAD